MPSIKLTPLPSLRISTHFIPPFALLPNSSRSLHSLYIYHAAFPPSTPPSAIECHLRTNAITPQWRYTMYTRTHFHSTTHEVLCVFRGSASLLFGGEDNPGKVEINVTAGDVMVVPAGVAHMMLREGDDGFEMVGGYPEGCSWDMCFGQEGDEAKVAGIQGVRWFERDPMYGGDGPVFGGKDGLGKRSRGDEK